MRRTVGAVTISDLWAVYSQTLHRLLKIPAGHIPGIGSALGQDNEEGSLGRNPEQALAQLQQVLDITGYPVAYRNQTILVELRGLNEQGALVGRVIRGGEADAFRDAQTASVEEMIKNVAGLKAEGSEWIGRVIRLPLKIIEETPQLLNGEDVRAVVLEFGDGKSLDWILGHPSLTHQVTTETMKSNTPVT